MSETFPIHLFRDRPQAPVHPVIDLPAQAGIRRILIIKWSAMGDVVMSTAVMEDIRRAFPQAEIHLNAMPPWDMLFREDPRFARIFAPDLRKKERGLKGMWNWMRTVAAENYDLVVDLQTTDRSRLLLGMLTLIGRAPRYRIGNLPVFPYNIRPPQLPRPVHAITLMRAAIQAGGIPAAQQRPALHVPQKNRDQAQALADQHGLKKNAYAVLLPGCQAAGYLKRWGAERYAALAQELKNRGIIDRAVIIGAKDEMEECEAIAAICGDWAINLCGSTHLLDLIPLCENARLIVANDTGTAHMASSTERPMLVLCGPTDPNRIKPLGNNVLALQAELPCMNCYCKHPCDHHSCMKALTPEIALTHLLQLLDQTGG